MIKSLSQNSHSSYGSNANSELKLDLRALTSRGLEPVLLNELRMLGAKDAAIMGSAVRFVTNWEGACQALLQLRTATRLIWSIAEFQVKNYDDIYNQCLKKIAFEKYFSVEQSFKILASTSDNQFTKQPLIAMKVKDAICDRFREHFGERPSVAKENPDVQWMVRVQKGQLSISIDLSGDSLTFRGYRKLQGAASLKEHLAAGLIKLADWQLDQPLVDPMCGSGTLLIEAALIMKSRTSQHISRSYGIEKLPALPKGIFSKQKQLAYAKLETTRPLIFGYDQDPAMIRLAESNADRAGVKDWIRFQTSKAEDWVPPEKKPGVLVCNPPYGKRLSNPEEARELYYQFGRRLKAVAGGWTLWILSGDPEATQGLQMKASQRHLVYNGDIEARWLQYKLRAKTSQPS